MATLPIELRYIDALGQTGRVTFYRSGITTLAELEAAANAIASVIAPLSSAVCFQAYVEVAYATYNPPAAGASSNVYARSVLVFRVGERRGVITVPSPDALPFDVAGPYRGIRLHPSTPGVPALLTPLESATGLLVHPDGGAFPGTFVVGSRTDLPT